MLKCIIWQIRQHFNKKMVNAITLNILPKFELNFPSLPITKYFSLLLTIANLGQLGNMWTYRRPNSQLYTNALFSVMHITLKAIWTHSKPLYLSYICTWVVRVAYSKHFLLARCIEGWLYRPMSSHKLFVILALRRELFTEALNNWWGQWGAASVTWEKIVGVFAKSVAFLSLWGSDTIWEFVVYRNRLKLYYTSLSNGE